MLQKTLLCYSALLLLVLEHGETARILAIFPIPGKSHFISFSPLLEELAKRGHEMTVVTAFPRKNPLANYRDIAISDYFNKEGKPLINTFETHDTNTLILAVMIRHMSIQICEEFLSDPEIQQLIKGPDDQFDLIIYEPFFSECSYGFMHKFKVPFIQISSNTITKWMGDGVGNPFFYSYTPDVMLGYSHHMTFTERMMNTVMLTVLDLERNLITLPRMESLMRKYFNDPNIPPIHEIETNASFLLLNSHVSLNFPRPLTPNTAEVGGMHLRDPKKLPQDLQKLLDNAKDGVIYFSLGSSVRSIDMPDEMRKTFLNSFSKIKQTVLWKWESDSMPGKPQNVHLSKWFPQGDLLGHPNVKAFITHGGLLSTQEATYLGIPLIAIPFMADQKQNALAASGKGYAIILNLKNITESSLDWALQDILTNNQYRENAKYLSNILRDQPQKPLDRAVFWTEYVIRHKGAPHMRSAALKLNFFQYYLLDVIGAIFAIVSVLLVLLMTITRLLCRRLLSTSKPVKSTTQKKVN